MARRSKTCSVFWTGRTRAVIAIKKRAAMRTGEVREGQNALLSPFQDTFTDFAMACPYGLPREAVFHQGWPARRSDQVLRDCLAAGFRRNGNILYTMRCRGCSACIPIRLAPRTFVPNRNQKRVLARNRDLTMETGNLLMGAENLALCDKFLRHRFPAQANSAAQYYSDFFLNGIATSFEIRYRLAGKLLGVAIVDISSDWLNAVYFYFDPDAAQRSLGTFNILSLINLCRRQRIQFLYLGYLLQEVSAMRYKEKFRPHELLIEGCWVKQSSR